MSAEPILRPEFDLYVKMTAEAMRDIAESTKESAKESRENNQILKEYIIHNNNKHDETKKHLSHQGREISKLKEAVSANSDVTRAAKYIKWAIGIVLAGALTAYGSNLYNNYSIESSDPKNKQAKKANP